MKKIIVLLTILIVITGCFNGNTEISKFYLDSEYYNNGTIKDLTKDELNNLQNNKSSYILFVYNSYCSFTIPCDLIFEEVAKKNNIDMYSLPFEIMKDTFIYDKVKYAPSIILINKGNIIAYLDPEKDSDTIKYQDTIEFEKWLSNYIYLEKQV